MLPMALRYDRSAYDAAYLALAGCQLPGTEWHSRFVDLTFGDAILYQLSHNAYRSEMVGE